MKKLEMYLGGLLLFAGLLTACDLSVNKTIHIGDGETVKHDLNSVNGSIVIGKDCNVDGRCRTVNGGIEIGQNSQVRALQTINGSISLGRHVIARDKVESVNGSITAETGAQVQGNVSSINGSIKLYHAEVQEDITTVKGNISLADSSVTHGNMIVKNSKGGSRRSLKIELSGGSVVEGDIMVQDQDANVEVYLLNGSKVSGEVKNAKIIEG